MLKSTQIQHGRADDDAYQRGVHYDLPEKLKGFFLHAYHLLTVPVYSDTCQNGDKKAENQVKMPSREFPLDGISCVLLRSELKFLYRTNVVARALARHLRRTPVR